MLLQQSTTLRCNTLNLQIKFLFFRIDTPRIRKHVYFDAVYVNFPSFDTGFCYIGLSSSDACYMNGW